MPHQGRTLIRAALVVDGQGLRASPGAVLLENSRILACGEPATIGQPSGATLTDLPNAVVLPALVNVHCHLDLSHIGPMPLDSDFVSWIEQLRLARAETD